MNSQASSTIEHERKLHRDSMERLRSEHAKEVDSLRAGLELVRVEAKEEVKQASLEAESRAARDARDQIRALAASHEAELRRAGKEVVRLQKLLKKKGLSAGVGDEFAVSSVYTAQHRCEDEEGAGKKNRLGGGQADGGAASAKTSRSGKIASGGGLAPTWLSAIDRSGDDLNAGKHKNVDSILRRSVELRDKIEDSNDRAGTSGGTGQSSFSSLKWGAVITSMDESKVDDQGQGAGGGRKSATGGSKDLLTVKEWEESFNNNKPKKVTGGGGGKLASKKLQEYIGKE